MIAICSKNGYPGKNQILVRVDYFVKASPAEGGILMIGRDSLGNEYQPKIQPNAGGLYQLPSGLSYSVPIGSYSAIYFTFELECLGYVDMLSDVEFDDHFFDQFKLVLQDEAKNQISFMNSEVERIFKEIAVWGKYELAGQMKNHFWGEMYRERTPALEKFLESFWVEN